ncbi:hypothetical protein MKW94_030868, partial [Papaver nudicaule]|nr:hypothetical protein [Papaver nudicaule]
MATLRNLSKTFKQLKNFSSSTSTITSKSVFKQQPIDHNHQRRVNRGGGDEENGLKHRNVHWVFLGCPGVGKGTYAGRLSNLLNVPHIATGDLVREELSSSGPLSIQLSDIVNQGKLLSDELIFRLLSKRLETGEENGESGFILDGFPRTVRQAGTSLNLRLKSSMDHPFG